MMHWAGPGVGLLTGALLAACLSLVSGAANAAQVQNPFGIELPSSMEDMMSVAHQDEEAGFSFMKGYSAFYFQGLRRYEDPRLGYSLAYASPAGTDISVYVYDLGMRVPDGTGSELVSAQLDQASSAIAESGRYAAVEALAAAPALSPHFLQSAQAITTRDGLVLKSYTLLRGQNGHFIKIRVTGVSEAMESRLVGFLKYLAADLGVDDPASGD